MTDLSEMLRVLNRLLVAVERIECRLIALEAQQQQTRPQREFVGRNEIAKLLGKSAETVDNYREKYWSKGVHWSIGANGRPLFNVTLILDWQRNANSLEHQRTIERYGREQQKKMR